MPIAGEEGFIGRVDFYWKKYRTIAEVDGALKYADPSRARKQLWRDMALREAGYEVVHFDWREITTQPARWPRRSARLSGGAAVSLPRPERCTSGQPDYCSDRIASSSASGFRTTGPVVVTTARLMIPANGNGAM